MAKRAQSLYLSEEAIEAIKATRDSEKDRSMSWAADKLILRGARVVTVPSVVGDAADLVALAESEERCS